MVCLYHCVWNVQINLPLTFGNVTTDCQALYFLYRRYTEVYMAMSAFLDTFI